MFLCGSFANYCVCFLSLHSIHTEIKGWWIHRSYTPEALCTRWQPIKMSTNARARNNESGADIWLIFGVTLIDCCICALDIFPSFCVWCDRELVREGTKQRIRWRDSLTAKKTTYCTQTHMHYPVPVFCKAIVDHIAISIFYAVPALSLSLSLFFLVSFNEKSCLISDQLINPSSNQISQKSKFKCLTCYLNKDLPWFGIITNFCP